MILPAYRRMCASNHVGELLDDIVNAVVILSRVAVLASDLMVLVVTWWQLCGALRSSRQGWNRSALVILLLRDGKSTIIVC